MKKISIFIIVLSAATLVGFTFDYVVHATKLKYLHKQAEILKNKYNNDEPSVDYSEVKRQRDSLYFLLNQETIMKFRRGIYDKMGQAGYVRTYDEFIVRNESTDRADELWEALYRIDIYSDHLWVFKRDFYGILPTK